MPLSLCDVERRHPSPGAERIHADAGGRALYASSAGMDPAVHRVAPPPHPNPREYRRRSTTGDLNPAILSPLPRQRR